MNEIVEDEFSEKTKYILPITENTDITIFQSRAILMQVPLLNEHAYPCVRFHSLRKQFFDMSGAVEVAYKAYV